MSNEKKFYTWLEVGRKPGPGFGAYIGRYLEYRDGWHYLVFPDEINVQAIDDVNFKRARLATEQEVAEAVDYEIIHGFFGVHPLFMMDEI